MAVDPLKYLAPIAQRILLLLLKMTHNSKHFILLLA
jgi:hypothetical protein